ncbi:3-oxoacyl-ACP synthase III family protein [Robiginitalea marina]|uniref:Ketoacyl-ACP synthase III n=1 Tax=Robiginitalea marina TaxID=2954105 RepID=A0ABT1AVT0_9FLAO|nr:3-oxoacyl-[acyl-carrier-protein] synthase III C-terminal domain-containing protein [Robiginitalea marina]MCO5723313.1 ketoacyl-ACP synthase III [Robiginitalea marina]
MKLKLVMGYDKRRVVKEGTAASDLCIYGLNYLFDNGYLRKDEIDALVMVNQVPDHFMPATTHIIQGKLDLPQEMFCIDIPQACAGYPIGLQQAFMLLEQENIKKVVVLNAELLSLKTSPADRGSRPLTGDAAAITIVENDPNGKTIYSTADFDGRRADALIIPAGAGRMPSSAETAKLTTDSNGNTRSLDHMVMKGDGVFNFVLNEVPEMIERVLGLAGRSKEEVDYFMFHQPNRFVLKKLADKLEIPYDKMPYNIVELFGNSCSPTLAVNLTYNLSEELTRGKHLICLAGFGAGLSWSSMLMEMGNLDFCETIDYK